jgi:hypothetical protein
MPTLIAFPDDFFDELAKHVAPLVIAELRRNPQALGPHLTADWDPATCSTFVSNLGDRVLERAEKFFEALESRGKVASPELAKRIGVKRTTDIQAALTTALKRRARKLALERPWNEDRSGGRVVWLDRNGIARRMREAIASERSARGI